jgi:hypothetical protein
VRGITNDFEKRLINAERTIAVLQLWANSQGAGSMTQAELREAGLPFLCCPFCQGQILKGRKNPGCSRCNYTGVAELRTANGVDAEAGKQRRR